MLKIALGTDHAGYKLKEAVKRHLQSKGYTVEDFGTNSEEMVDYPDFIIPAAQSVANGKNELGIVFGGSGNGEAIAANKVKGIRCGVCWHEESGRLTRLHNNANVISMGGRLVDEAMAIKIVDAWLNASFEGGRHQKRLEKLDQWVKNQ